MIGAGSGGIASARRAATHGAKVAVCEKGALGGTCVNVGCVPKKVMYNAAHIMECVHDAPLYQYSGTDSVKLDWNKLKTARDNYVTRLNGIYGRNMEGSGVTKLEGLASFSGPNEVEVAGQKYTADHILVAVGGKPTMPADLEGVEHCISSDGFFLLEEMPSSALVVGAGYIAVEMAGILHALGCKTELAVRGEKPLRAFDDLMSDTLVRGGVPSFVPGVRGSVDARRWRPGDVSTPSTHRLHVNAAARSRRWRPGDLSAPSPPSMREGPRRRRFDNAGLGDGAPGPDVATEDDDRQGRRGQRQEARHAHGRDGARGVRRSVISGRPGTVDGTFIIRKSWRQARRQEQIYSSRRLPEHVCGRRLCLG